MQLFAQLKILPKTFIVFLDTKFQVTAEGVGRIVEKAVGGHGQQVFTNCLKQVFILLGVDRSDTAADGVVKGHLLEQLGLIEKDRFAALNHFRFAIDLLEQRKVVGADWIPAAQFMTVWLQRIGDFIER